MLVNPELLLPNLLSGSAKLALMSLPLEKDFLVGGSKDIFLPEVTGFGATFLNFQKRYPAIPIVPARATLTTAIPAIRPVFESKI